MKKKSKQIPIPVIQRYPKYFLLVQELEEAKVEWVPSKKLAHFLGLTSSTVRQDLSYLDFNGVAKRGYEIKQLKQVLLTLLLSSEKRLIIVGAGNFGRALALNREFAKKGFKIHAIFDSDLRLYGRKVGDITIQSMDEIAEVVKKSHIDIGVITVPAAAAQEVADVLISAGVQGLLNISPTNLQVPSHIPVIDVRISASLLELSCALEMQRRMVEWIFR